MFEKQPLNNKDEKKLSRVEIGELKDNVDYILSLEEDEYSIEMDEFVDLVGEAEVTYDKEELADIKKRKDEKRERMSKEERDAEKESEKIGKALERVMQYLIEGMTIFGEFSSKKASEYDDYVNGVDLLMGVEDSKMIFGVDVTTASQREATVSEKIDRNIKKMIGKGSAEVKYSYSFIDHEQKEKNDKVIPVVIGFDLINCNELFSNFCRIKRLEKKIEDIKSQKNQKEKLQSYREIKVGAEEELMNLPIYGVLFEQVEQQLEKYLQLGLENKEIEIEVRRFLEKIRATRGEEHKNALVVNDGVLKNISSKLDIVSVNNLEYFKKAV